MHVLMGVQVCVVVVLMLSVPTVCFCMGLLLHNSSLRFIDLTLHKYRIPFLK